MLPPEQATGLLRFIYDKSSLKVHQSDTVAGQTEKGEILADHFLLIVSIDKDKKREFAEIADLPNNTLLVPSCDNAVRLLQDKSYKVGKVFIWHDENSATGAESSIVNDSSSRLDQIAKVVGVASQRGIQDILVVLPDIVNDRISFEFNQEAQITVCDLTDQTQIRRFLRDYAWLKRIKIQDKLDFVKSSDVDPPTETSRSVEVNPDKDGTPRQSVHLAVSIKPPEGPRLDINYVENTRGIGRDEVLLLMDPKDDDGIFENIFTKDLVFRIHHIGEALFALKAKGFRAIIIEVV